MIKNRCSKVGNVVEVYVTQRHGVKHVVLLDLDDFERINKMEDFTVHVWFSKNTNSFYARYHDENYKTKKLHRLIMDTPEGLMTDHANHNTLDNRRCNLRNVSNRENGSNLKRKSEMSSQYVGVYWNKRDEKWQAQIKINGKKKSLGYFSTELQAYEAYSQAVQNLH